LHADRRRGRRGRRRRDRDRLEARQRPLRPRRFPHLHPGPRRMRPSHRRPPNVRGVEAVGAGHASTLRGRREGARNSRMLRRVSPPTTTTTSCPRSVPTTHKASDSGSPGAGITPLPHGGDRLSLVEPNAGGKYLLETVGPERLADLSNKLGLPPPQRRPRLLTHTVAQTLGRTRQQRCLLYVALPQSE